MIGSFRLDVASALTGEPIEVAGGVSAKSAVVRVADTVYVATRSTLTLGEAEDLQRELAEVLRG